MNLKKIIKEEMDDFDWANDVTGINHLEWEKNSENFGGPANLARDLYNNDPMGFLNMLNNLNIVQSKENSDWTLFKCEKGNDMMIYDRKYKYVYIGYYNIWLFLSEGFGLNHTEIQSLTKKWLGEAYNLRGITIKHTLFSCFLSLGESYNLKRYLNLKKIIKEEMDDFDWIRDSSGFNVGQKYILVMVDESLEYKKRVLDELEWMGYISWTPKPILDQNNNIIDYELIDGDYLADVCYLFLEDFIYHGEYFLGGLNCPNRGYTREWIEGRYGEEYTIISSREIFN